jgi:CubicO group peptidase (beta-lactamase class C family)
MVFSNHLRSLVEHSLRSFQVPGLIVALTEQRAAPSYLIAGADAAGVPLREDSMFPVASITKLAVALAVLRLADAGALSWRDSLARYLPEAAAAQEGVTLHTLLTHTSGLPSSYPDEAALYQLGLTWPMIAQACLRTALVQPPNTSVCYSGVGYSLLALVVERVTGQRFGAALSKLVLAPLGIEAYLGQEPPRPVAVIDVEQSPFTGTPLEFYNSQFFRTLGEPAGGLLTTAAGALRLISAYQNQPLGFLRPETAAAATRNQVPGLGGGVPGWFTLSDCPWGLGPALAATFPWVPKKASAQSYGHTGASGCMVWYDPAAARAWVVLGTKIPDSGWCDQLFPQLGAALLAADAV